MIEQNILHPAFDQAYWRSEQRTPYRKHANFSAKKKHFEPEEHSSFADRFAADLTRDESREEIRRIYENSVTLLKNKRSGMERGDQSLEAKQFRYVIQVSQDSSDPSLVHLSRHLHVKIPLNSLPEHFDDLFLWKATEIVIPFETTAGQRQLLEILELWEERLQGKIEESADQNQLTLRLSSGFSLMVDIAACELVVAMSGVEGVMALAAAVAGDLKKIGIAKELV